MSPALSKEISQLTPDERLDLIGLLWDMIDHDRSLTPAQTVELNRRLETLDDDRADAVPWAVVNSELTGRLQS